jgi:hypothetical protein
MAEVHIGTPLVGSSYTDGSFAPIERRAPTFREMVCF